MALPVIPNSYHGSTTFNSKIKSYDLLAQRIRRALGEPLIQIEISSAQIYEAIDLAIEFFTKFSGTTEEFLIFKSDLYIPKVGLPIGRLINITPDLQSSANPDSQAFPASYKARNATDVSEYVTNIGNNVDSEYVVQHNLDTQNVIVQIYDNVTNEQVYTTTINDSRNTTILRFNQPIPLNSLRVIVLTGSSTLRHVSVIGNGSSNEFTVFHNLNNKDVVVQVFNQENGELSYPNILNASESHVVIKFEAPIPPNSHKVVVVNGQDVNPVYNLTHSAGWDMDLNNYRRVIDVYSFAEGNNSGVNTLFTIEHTIAQQAYFGHLLGNVGYDLITWQFLKGWLETREKVLATTPYLRFYPEDQILKLVPEPSVYNTYYGVVGCRLQKPLKDLINQLWVYRYSLALTKIAVAHVRGKYGGSNLFGGQSVSYQDLMNQGVNERDALEKEITQDQIDRDPIRFFIG
jgi:hypothetical protein